MQIKLTDKAREALLLAELIAWARRDQTVKLDALSWALCQQQFTTARRVVSALERKKLDDLELLNLGNHNLFKDLTRNLALKFDKIPLGDDIYKMLERCALEALELGYEEDITTGQILAQILFDSKEFGERVKKLELDLPEFKLNLINVATEEKSVQKEIIAGHAPLSQFNRIALNWLRDGNLSNEVLLSIGIESPELISESTTLKLIEYFGEDQNKEIPDMKPPLRSGIREKARRDLEVVDSFVTAKNLPDAEPNLIGMYMNTPQEFILFYEEGFAFVADTEPIFIPYKEIEAVETICDDEIADAKVSASIAITRGDGFDLEFEVPACTNDIPDVYALDKFLESARDPQPIIEIDTDSEFVTFLLRQNDNLDLYYRLVYKVEELWQLGWWDEKKGAQLTLLLRLLALLATVPMQSFSPSVNR